MGDDSMVRFDPGHDLRYILNCDHTSMCTSDPSTYIRWTVQILSYSGIFNFATEKDNQTRIEPVGKPYREVCLQVLL